MTFPNPINFFPTREKSFTDVDGSVVHHCGKLNNSSVYVSMFFQ